MKADVKSSGIAAPMAQPHQAGELGISLFPQFSDDLKNGANNFKLLLDRVYEISEETVFQFGEGDGRDYPRMCFEVETAILANLLGSGKAVREGFLRAMTDLIAHHVDGAAPPDNDEWDPLATTSAAFARQGEAA